MKNKLKETREGLNITQEELAKTSTISRTTISEIENGKKSKVTSYTLEKIASALNTRVRDIFFIE